jgi:hypothetical protein
MRTWEPTGEIYYTSGGTDMDLSNKQFTYTETYKWTD